MKNGGFDWACTCPWTAGVSAFDPPPVISIDPTSGHCEYARIGDENFPFSLQEAKVEQGNFVVAAQPGEFIVLEFDARTFGEIKFIDVSLTVSNAGSIVRSPSLDSSWHHYRMSLLNGPTNGPQASIAFVICSSLRRLDVDNVTVHSAGLTNPCPTPDAVGCDMTEPPSFELCTAGSGPVTLLVVGADPFCCRCTADFNEDNKVNVVDWLQLLAAWNQSGCLEENLDDCTTVVGQVDLNLLLLQWGNCGCIPAGGAPASGSGSQDELELAVMAMGFADLAAYQDWLLQAGDAEALASAYVLAALLSG